MRVIATLFLFLMTITVSKGQTKVDTIFLSNGETVSAIVQEITPEEVKYVSASNTDGPKIVMPKSKISSIRYANGITEQYSGSPSVRISPDRKVSSAINYDNYAGRESDDPNANSYDFSDRFLRETPVVYYGIDFTICKFIGSSGFNDPAHIVDKYLDGINQKIVREQDKYDMGIFFKRRDYDIDLEMLSGRNRSINPYEVVTNSNHTISEDQIKQLVNSYTPKAQEGIGLVIVMESLNKQRERGIMYFTFFDIKTKEVLHLRKVSEEPSGFGITNYWMKPVYNALKRLKREYR